MCRVLRLAPLLLALPVTACAKGVPTLQPVTPGAELRVDTPDIDTTSAILASVDAMLFKNPPFFRKMLSHGFDTATSYSFKFRGTCASDLELQKAVKAEIAQSVSATVTCVEIRQPKLPQ